VNETIVKVKEIDVNMTALLSTSYLACFLNYTDNPGTWRLGRVSRAPASGGSSSADALRRTAWEIAMAGATKQRVKPREEEPTCCPTPVVDG
jgi:hypothetical protein